MNPGFYSLPQERRNQIINAGFRIFSMSDYRKAPVAEIAAEAGISKALLFYHFKNKKELYLFLWQEAVALTSRAMISQEVMSTSDLFEMMHRSLKGKCQLMRQYPYAGEFSLRAYYEQDPDVAGEIQEQFAELNQQSELKMLDLIDQSRLREGIDLHEVYQEMVYAADGYMHMARMRGELDPEQIETDFSRLIRLWKKAYQSEEGGQIS